jgi:hypothetical protein
MMGISGATANHAKKQVKNASHDKWNARIGMLEKFHNWIRVARPFICQPRVKQIRDQKKRRAKIRSARSALLTFGGVAKEASRQKEKPHQSCGGMQTLLIYIMQWPCHRHRWTQISELAP